MSKKQRAMGTDARKWAKEFCKRSPELDLDWVQGWFANAIMTGFDEGARLKELELAENKEASAAPCRYCCSGPGEPHKPSCPEVMDPETARQWRGGSK